MKEFFTLKLVTMLTWTVIVLISLILGGYTQYQHSVGIAKDVLDANFDKDQSFRAWGSSHGGVYVPVDIPRTPPSPYMKHIKERDIQTPSGKKLTLMNPASMIRQMNNEWVGLYGSKAHITALEILNPSNIADTWERKALKAFKNEPELKEVIEFSDIDGVTNMRLIRPMLVGDGCLKCHGHQKSYKNTKTAGGVSVSLPMSGIYFLGIESLKKTAFIHLFFLLIGLLLINFIFKKEKKAIDELEHLANHDNLTGLPNRHAYNDKVESSLNDSSIDNIYMLFMDLDSFKIINDTLGHSVGDLLLQNVAKRLENRITGFEIFARFGGDEFVFLFTNVSNSTAIEKITQRIQKVFEEGFMLKGCDVHTSVSIGIASYPNPAVDAKALLRNADIAMYCAKRAGRSQYAFYDEQMSTKSKGELRLEGELHKAIIKDELFLLYQPQIALDSEKIVGVEALIRWNNPKSGLISPIVFIPIAENNGLIISIGEWIIDQACNQLASWKDTPMAHLTLSINISAKQLLHQNLHSYIRKAITRTCINGGLLELEITESVIMENINETIEILRDLKTLGITIAIDDFGTGYSSLSYLKKLPIDKLKIDREFIKDIPEDKDDIAITNAIVSLAKALDFKIVAEGPERGEHVDFLKEVGCDIAQGYYYSRPISSKGVEKFLN
ncbi:MAG: diguanylate cyclase (GGDEF)-like protein [Sulfurimonas sp.]|jgi:diguanylate cyclase (GGDEF)-like protein|uniref:EAL domain-containing protein n=1 Tax=Sulfurimonas sp. TaxID=2022749 RepID=UPI0039E43E18